MKVRVILFFLLVFGVTGYLRERFFEHLNIIMASVYRGTDEYALLHTKMPMVMKPFSHMSYATLYYSKYAYTLIWTLIFFTISYFALKRLVTDKKIIKFLVYSYVILLALSALSMVYGYLATNSLKNDEYTLSRWLLGIAQSPIICLILAASEQLYKKSFNHDTKG